MDTPNVGIYRSGHQAFNHRDLRAMTSRYAPTIVWTDHAAGRTFTTPEEFTTDFLSGWLNASSDIAIHDPAYIDGGGTVVCTFTVTGTHDGPFGPYAATGKPFTLSLCEMWHFDPDGQVVGGDLYYNLAALLLQLGLLPQPAGT
jgi:steroid delta-isomerase-like uncharacterized protein